MKFILPLSVLVLAGLVWSALRVTTTGLQAELALAHDRSLTADALRAVRDRLSQHVPTAGEWAQLRRAAEERDALRRELAARTAPADQAVPSTLSAGEWLAVDAWKNRGRATPAAALETTLWAAAGGDLPALKNLLLLDPAVLAQATALLARLPESSRALYPTPEHLVAAFTAKAIPLGAAQLVSQQSSVPDDTTVCLFLRNQPGGMEPAGPASLPPVGNNTPPMQASTGTSKSTVLSLRRTDDGWGIVVPSAAIAKIARELGGSAQAALDGRK